MSYLDSITHLQLDTLKEIGNIGAGNAATALSLLVNKPVMMSVPSVKIATFDETMELAGGADNVVASVYMRIEGDITGNMYFILSLSQATRFINQMTGSNQFSFDHSLDDEISLSALTEMGNILSGSYLSSLSDFTGMKIYPSVPVLGIDMVGALLGYGLLEFSQVGDYAIIIDTDFTESDSKEEKDVNGHFFLLPDPESFDTLFSTLGVNME
ncbi:chemotaxis protein CheC [Pradoshia sp. D12]|uniref:chemotaxis protein CheC n=1 Tax=Bacillaceae TaxID=186817 RepID=UPI00112170CA|nr:MULTISPECIES: chemotaxis protein CheC [Bacillaceae]QFK71001.1 chemotaxis protein CheC [Pradoshia sp. D12]TPF72793.1 chemotaxis protein CheC [Bacillus sp. D12]